MYNKTDDSDFENEIYYDIKRLIIQERGEDEYQYIYKNKSSRLQEQIDDEFTRMEIRMNMDHYN